MLRAGLVQKNYGYGIRPSSHKGRWASYDTEMPHVSSSFDSGFTKIRNSPYQQSIVTVIQPFKNDLTPKIVNPPIFEKPSYQDLFGRPEPQPMPQPMPLDLPSPEMQQPELFLSKKRKIDEMTLE